MIGKHSHGMLKLNDLIEGHLYDGGKRIFVSVDQTAFTHIFSCFHNYEVSVYVHCMCFKCITL